MEIKGTAVRSIPEFIKNNHLGKYDVWLESLPETSKQVFQNPILPANWYPMDVAATIPTKKLGEILYNDPLEGAWQSGRYSADIALKGIYKFFIQAASPFFIINRAGKVLSTYYQPSEMKVVDKGDNWVILHITHFEEPNDIIENRIGGWIERALEIHGVSSVTVEIPKSLTRGDKVTEFRVNWKYS